MNMKFFEYAHLPDHLQAVSKPFHLLAWQIKKLPRTVDPEAGMMAHSDEIEMCLRKLLEAKDCAVRARSEMP